MYLRSIVVRKRKMGVHLPWKKTFNNSRMVGNFLSNLGNNNKISLETFLALSKTWVWDISACRNRNFCTVIDFYTLWQPNFVWKYLLMTFLSKAEILKEKKWNSNGILAGWFPLRHHLGLISHLLRHFYVKCMFSQFLPTFRSAC